VLLREIAPNFCRPIFLLDKYEIMH